MWGGADRSVPATFRRSALHVASPDRSPVCRFSIITRYHCCRPLGSPLLTGAQAVRSLCSSRLASVSSFCKRSRCFSDVVWSIDP